MKKRCTRLGVSILSLALAFSLCVTCACASSYTDVSDQDWYADAVDYVTAHEIMGGTGNGAFSPQEILTRAQIVALFHRLSGSPEPEAPADFRDVPADEWFAKPVAWAGEQGLVYGTGPDTFSPLDQITREQLAALIERYVGLRGARLYEAVNPVIGFKDSWRISDYAIDGAKLVWRAGIMNGDSQHNFDPKSPVSRADAAVIFMRLDRALAGERLTVSVRDTTPDHAALSADQKNAAALTVAQQIAAFVPTDLSDLDRVSMAASIVSYYCQFCEYTMSGGDYRTPYGVFIKGEYSCAGATRALGMVLTCMGYSWTHINENQYSHQWCELYMDGQLGYADGQVGIAGYGRHPAA